MMTFDNGATDGQPDTHPAILGGVKRFEKLVQVLRSKTHACVLYAQAHLITFVSFGSDDQLSRTIVYAAHRVGGIQEQIQHDLLKLDTIGRDRREVVGKFDPRNHLASLKFTPRQRNHLSNGLIQVYRFGRGVPLATDGLPAGVVNILTSGREGLEYLVETPDVPVISFTGSTATGRAISAAGAARLKRFGLELGGKMPMVIFDDADLDAAVAKVTSALTVFAGQFCMTGSRAIVQRGIEDRFRVTLADRLEKVRVGPASDPRSEIGPLINKPNVERVNKLVEGAIAAGAKIIVRGGPATDGPLANGAFYRPTLLEMTDSSLPIVQQEVFGPVLTMQVFDTEAEAVSLANDSEYGLAASVWSRDVDRPLRVARVLQHGTVWINDWANMHDEFEEGGFKQSGRGRLRGQAGLDDFLECKHIAFKPGTIKR